MIQQLQKLVKTLFTKVLFIKVLFIKASFIKTAFIKVSTLSARRTLLVITAMCFIFSSSVYALGLGGIKLKSTLGQTLDADIELLNISERELSEVSIQLASTAVYERMGIERSIQLEQLKFRVFKSDDGKNFIHVTTPLTVTEPFLNFLVEINWSSGRLLREFTVLLDPPVFLDEEGGATVSTASTAESTVNSTPSRSSAPTDSAGHDASVAMVSADASGKVIDEKISRILSGETATTQNAVSSTPSASLKSSQFQVQVQQNDILWRIADKMRPEDISVEQMMLALQHENPQAFFGDNVSMLKAGAVLRITDVSALNDVSVAQAIMEIAKQNQAWLSFRKERQARNAVAAESANLAPMGSNSGDSSAASRGVLADAGVANEPLLKLVAPVDKNSKSQSESSNAALEAAEDKANELNIELVMVNEQLEVTKRENEELVSRLSSLEEQMSAMQSLVQLKDAELAKLRTGEVVTVDSESLLTPLKVEMPEVETSAETTVTKVISKDNVAQIKKLWQDPLTLGTAIFAILLIALIGILLKRKSARKSAVVVPEVREASEVTDIAVEKTGKTGDMVAELFPEDSANPKPGEKINAAFHQHEALVDDLAPMTDIIFDNTVFVEPEEYLLDPISEADVYLTYEKFDKAEKLLKEAIQSIPERHELKVKLLEVYAESGDQELFSSSADELYAAINGEESHPLWLQATSLANAIGSDNPLFSGKNDLALDIDEPFNVDQLDISDTDVVTDENLTSSILDESHPEVEWAPEQATALSLNEESAINENNDILVADDFDPSLLDEVHGSSTRPSILEKGADTGFIASDNTSSGMDSGGSDKTAGTNSPATEITDEDLQQAMSSFTDEATNDKLTEENDKAESDITVSDVFDDIPGAGSDSSAADAQSETSFFLLSDEVGTKLDLARAYIEMGDHDGASDLLNEVLSEGNQQQKLEAKELMEMTAA